MADGDSLPISNHIIRVCKGSTIDEDGRPQATAFMLRVGPPLETYASVCWLEMLGNDGDQSKRIEVAKVILNKKMRTMNQSAKLALLNVGEILNQVNTNLPEHVLLILHTPTIKDNVVIDNSHAGIYNLPLETDDHGVAEFVARAVSVVYPAKI